MGDFVRRYLLHEAGEFAVDRAEKHQSLCRIGVDGDREINQVRPGLPKIKIRLLRDVDLFIRTLAEIQGTNLQLRARLFQSIFRHAAGRQGLQRPIPAQIVGQLTQVVARNLVAREFIRQIEPLILAVVESRDCHGDRRDPVADGQVLLNRLSFKVPHADDFVFSRHFEGKIVKSFLAKSVQVGIPRGARADVETPFARFFQDLIARVLDTDRLFFAKWRRLGKYGVKRTVLFAALLNEIKILTLLIRDSRDSKIGQQTKLKHSLSGDQRRKADGGSAEQMPVLRNDGLDLVAPGGK